MTTTQTHPGLLLNAKQACAALGGVSERTLFAWRVKKRLPFVQMEPGGPYLYPVESLRAWVAERTSAMATED